MLDGTGRVRITDFGLAGVVAAKRCAPARPRTWRPSSWPARRSRPRSDIYALGLVLYEIFTGRRALEGSNLAELIRRREQAEITPPSRDSSAIWMRGDRQRDHAVSRARPSAERPASALAVAAALPGGDPLAAALAAGETPAPKWWRQPGRPNLFRRERHSRVRRGSSSPSR